MSFFLKACLLVLLSLNLQCSLLSEPPPKVAGQALPDSCQQLIVGVTEDWNSSHVKLCLLKKNERGEWQKELAPWKGRLGHAGSVWGLGIQPVPAHAKLKKEGDGRTPVGIFALDNIVYSYESNTSVGKGYKVQQVSPYHLWVDDPKSPNYNEHLVLSSLPKTEWEKKQQMELEAPSHKSKLFIHHNSSLDKALGRPLAGRGSSIFFHIWREEGARATAGCTSMAEDKLSTLFQKLNTAQNPLYLILPRNEYQRYEKDWKLPPLPL